MRMMIVDDHEGMRETLFRLLARPGVEILECCTGEAAMDSARLFQPDWVIADINLPVANGFQVADVIRMEVPSARVILISAQPDIDLEEVLAVGAERFLRKHHLAKLPGMVYGARQAAGAAPG